MKKTILILVGLVLVVGVAAVVFLMQNLDGLVKQAIEKYGSEAAGTAVRVQSVKLELREGRGTLNGLTIANPPGYSNQPIFALNGISIDIDTGSLTSEVPIIEDISVGASNFRYEVSATGGNNLEVLQKNLKSGKSGKGAAGKPTDQSGAREPLRLKVKRLAIAGSEGTLDLSAVGSKEMQATVPGVTLTDLGGKQGITPKGLADAVLSALFKNLEKSAARQVAEKALRDRLDGETGKLQEKLDEKLGEGASDSLKKMFGQ